MTPDLTDDETRAPAELHACGQPPFWGPQSGSAVRLEELEAGEAEEISKAA
jgi:hypothetical protein